MLSQMSSSRAAAAATVVLVHGAFADSSSFNGVIARLQAQGYPVVAVANPLRGLKVDSEYVASVLKSIPGPTVLVGHWVGAFDKAQARQVFAGEDPFDEAAFAAGDTHAGDIPEAGEPAAQDATPVRI